MSPSSGTLCVLSLTLILAYPLPISGQTAPQVQSEIQREAQLLREAESSAEAGAAIDALVELVDRASPEQSISIVKALEDALADDPRPSVQKKAAQALGTLGPAARDAVRSVCSRAQSSPDSTVRFATITALGNMGIVDSAVTCLLDLLASNDPMDEAYLHRVAKALGSSKVQTEAVVEALRKSLDPVEMESIDLRRTAATALGELGPVAKAATPDLRGALRHRDQILRRRAATALGVVADQSVLPDLEESCDQDPVSEVRTAACEAVREIGNRNPRSPWSRLVENPWTPWVLLGASILLLWLVFPWRGVYGNLEDDGISISIRGASWHFVHYFPWHLNFWVRSCVKRVPTLAKLDNVGTFPYPTRVVRPQDLDSGQGNAKTALTPEDLRRDFQPPLTRMLVVGGTERLRENLGDTLAGWAASERLTKYPILPLKIDSSEGRIQSLEELMKTVREKARQLAGVEILPERLLEKLLRKGRILLITRDYSNLRGLIGAPLNALVVISDDAEDKRHLDPTTKIEILDRPER